MKLNVTKTKEFIISFVKDPKLLDPLTVNSLPLESINTTKLLGVHLSSDLKWSTHVEAVCAKANKRLFALRSLKRSGVPPRDLKSVYSYFIRPVLEYACPYLYKHKPNGNDLTCINFHLYCFATSLDTPSFNPSFAM